MVLMTRQLAQRNTRLRIDDMRYRIITDEETKTAIWTCGCAVDSEGEWLLRDDGVRLDVEDTHDAVIGAEDGVGSGAVAMLVELHVVCDCFLVSG